MVSIDQFRAYLKLLKSTCDNIDLEVLEQLKNEMLNTYNKNGVIYIFGNGGSGGTASHMSGDFLKGASYGLEKRFKMICLNDNYSGLAAIANDIGWEDVFVEQLKNFLSKDDLVIGISGSGNSKNVVKAMEYAKEQGVKTVAMCGFKGGKIGQMSDIVVHAKVMDMEVTEDVHMVVLHMVKQALIKELHGENGPNYGKVYEERIN